MSYTNDSEYAVICRCGRCGKKQTIVTTGKFRVNANKNKVDIWLIYQCARCRHTLNIPVYERINPGKLPRELYERFLENDRELAARYASDIRFLKSRHYVTAKNFPKNR